MTVQIPGKAINADGDDLEKPTTDLLRTEEDKPSSAPAPGCPIPLGGFEATNGMKIGSAEAGWKAIATRDRDGRTEFLLIKANEAEWVEVAQVVFA